MLSDRFGVGRRLLATGALLALTGSPAWATVEEPLDPEQAFRMAARIDSGGKGLEVNWQIADGYYLYRKRLSFSVSGEGSCATTAIDLPSGKIKDDENFGKVEIYRQTLSAKIEVPGCKIREIEVGYQGCGDIGVCFPPVSKRIALDGEPVAPVASVPLAGEQASSASTGDGEIADLLQGGNLFLILVSFLGFGLALSLTPCVFPMIPILSGIIVQQGAGVSRTRAGVLSGVYVLGMAVTYTLAGVLAGLSGTMISGLLQNPWVLGSFAALFVVLSLSMFGLFELQMPAWVQSRFSSASNSGGSVGGIALMGALSALIVGPCIAPPLAGALLYIAKTGDAALGGMALFTMAIGMGIPLMLVGVFSRAILPKAGGWMNLVTRIFGVAMLATAIWIVSPVVPKWLLMLSVAILLIGCAIYLHALDPLPATASGWARLWKGVGVAMLVPGCILLVGLMGGSRSLLQPLDFLHSAQAAEGAKPGKPHFERIVSSRELDERLKRASSPVIVDFYADWCVSCKELEAETFADPEVQRLFGSYTLVQIDMTDNTPDQQALLKRFGLFGPPAVLFFGPNGVEQKEKRVIGYLPPAQFKPRLDSLRQS